MRRMLEWSVPVFALAVIGLASSVWGDRVPDPMATHWGSGGRPDGSMPLEVSTAITGGMAALFGLGGLFYAGRAPGREVARWIVAGATGLAAFLAAVHVWTLRANLDAATWQDADGLAGVGFLLVLLAGVVVGGVGYLLAGDRPEPAVQNLAVEPIDAEASELVVWSGRATGAVVPVAGAILSVIGAGALFLAPAGLSFMGWSFLVLGPYVATYGVVRATVGPQGLRATVGLFARPGYRVALSDIESVEALTIEPVAVGGWGWRILPGSRALVVRRGEGLKVTRRGKADLYVTVDDAATGAAVLQRHLEHHRAAAG